MVAASPRSDKASRGLSPSVPPNFQNVVIPRKGKEQEMTIQEKRNQIAARTDETIREETAREIAPCAQQIFYIIYCIAHKSKFGKLFSIV